MIREDLLNTPIESGVRSLIVLNAVRPKQCDLRRLVVFDYLLVHSGDVAGGPTSIHANSPFQSGELIVRRVLVQRGLELVVTKGLLKRSYREDGVFYAADNVTASFLAYLESGYATKTKNAARWIKERFASSSDDELFAYIAENLGKWGTEFANDPFDLIGADE